MFQGLENSSRGIKVCKPQILSVFVCLQHKWMVEVPDAHICMLLRQDTPGREQDRKIEV